MAFRFDKLTIKAQEAVAKAQSIGGGAGQSADRSAALVGRAAVRGRGDRRGRAGADRRPTGSSSSGSSSRSWATFPRSSAGRHAAAPEPRCRGAGRRPARGRRDEGRVRLDRASAVGPGQSRLQGQERPQAQRRHRQGDPPGPAGRPRQQPGHRSEPRGQIQRPGALRHRPGRAGPAGQARSGDRPRSGNPPRDPGAFAADQEQPGADRRAGRGQDGDRRGAGPADRRGRRAGEPEEQAGRGPGHGRTGGRHQVPRRVRGAAQGRDPRSRGSGRRR